MLFKIKTFLSETMLLPFYLLLDFAPWSLEKHGDGLV